MNLLNILIRRWNLLEKSKWLFSLNICYKDKNLTKNIIKGYIFDKLHRNDNLYQYIVYIPNLKMTNRLVTTKDLNNLENYNFKIYIFMDEIHLKQKIRLLLV